MAVGSSVQTKTKLFKMENTMETNHTDLRIADDWGNGMVSIMLADEAQAEWDAQLDATRDGQNPDGWGSEPQPIDSDREIVWGCGETTVLNQGHYVITDRARTVLEPLVMAGLRVVSDSDTATSATYDECRA
jgi:hypothetical protein